MNDVRGQRFASAVFAQAGLLAVALVVAAIIVGALEDLGFIYTTESHTLWLTVCLFLAASAALEVRLEAVAAVAAAYVAARAASERAAGTGEPASPSRDDL